jgi:tetratricopeptide (TPR) repeat protein
MSYIGRQAIRLVLALALCGAVASVAAADDVDTIVKKGTELRRQGRDRDALAELQRAARIDETPRVTAQIALAEQALGIWEDAWSHLKKALDHTGDPWIQKNRAVLETALGVIEEHVGTIEIWGTPDGAEVLLDDKPIGKLPTANPAASIRDQVSLLVRSPGYVDFTRTVKVKMGGLVRERVELRRLPAALAAAPAAAATLSPAAVRGPASAPAAAESPPPAASLVTQSAPADSASAPETHESPFYKRWWFWTLVGAVAIGAGTGAYLLTRPAATPACTPPTCSNWSN